MCLKKYYSSIPNYVALTLALVELFLVIIITKLTIASNLSQSWQEMDVHNQKLYNLHMSYFIDDGGFGESIIAFSNISRDMHKIFQTNLEELCLQCIATHYEPQRFFKDMPYQIKRPIPKKFLVNNIHERKQKLLSFTYGLENLSQDFKTVYGNMRKNKTLTVYYNTHSLHIPFRALNFGHNLGLK